ncbi:DMT family transporter [Fulvivirga ulvae]|uniref:DMT family transporter n=1 Tax=Fulvivirga ulvae TaxID=2904245 RepID=UPI001F21EF1B|nr:DMT family transporter [Fulvivirga ulvae]UII31998.1 DMT family transporter [Fulvivirga ulvae]
MFTKGVRYMVIAGFFFALMNVFVKMVPDIPAVEIVFFRSLVSLILSYAFLKTSGVNIWGKNKRILLFRGASGAVALILYFATIQAIPLASAVTIQFLSPIFTSILGVFIVKERVKPLQWLFFVMAFAGIIIIQGFDPRLTPFYLGIGVIAALFSGLAYNFIRKLNTSEHPLVIVFYFPLVTLPVTGAISAFDWVNPEGWEWLLLLLIGVLTQVAQYFMTKAYQVEELSKVASLKYINIIYALAFGWVIFEETFNFMTYVGMLVVLTGVILNIWYKHHLASKKID